MEIQFHSANYTSPPPGGSTFNLRTAASPDYRGEFSKGPMRVYLYYCETYDPPTISATRELPGVGPPTRYSPARTWHFLGRSIALFYPQPATRGLPITRRIKLYRIPCQNNSVLSRRGNGLSRGPSVLHRHGCLVVRPSTTSRDDWAMDVSGAIHDSDLTSHCTSTLRSFRPLPPQCFRPPPPVSHLPHGQFAIRCDI